MDNDQITEMARKEGIAPWTMVCGLYGSTEQLRVSRKEIKSKLRKISKIIFINDSKVQLVRKTLSFLDWTRRYPFIHSLAKKLISLGLYKGSIRSLERVPKVYNFWYSL